MKPTIKPSDEELNIAMAEVCGYRWYRVMRCTYDSGPEGLPFRTLAKEEQMQLCLPLVSATGDEPIYSVELPMYCSDRNAVLEVWAALDAAGLHVWKNFVRVVVEWKECSLSAIYRAMKASPREQVEAALIALGKWNDEWKMQDNN